MSLIVDIRKKTGSFALDVSFRAEGGVHALLGGSGSGKSMTLKCIAGILTPDEGYIEIDGRVLYDSGKKSGRKINLPPQKRSVGYMFQDYALFPTMTVLQNVMEGMGRQKDRQRAEELLRRFHVEELADRLPGKLSGGQKQRVAMARIAAQGPQLVLLDEPFSALDSHLKWVLQNEMRATLHAMGCPAVMVTHSRDEVYRLCTSVCCLQEGRSEKTRAVKDFFEDPGTVTAARLSGCKNVSPVEILDDNTLFAKDWNVVLHLHGGIPDEIRTHLYAVGIRAHRFHAVKEEGDNNAFAVKEPSLMEDPFEWNVSFYPEIAPGLQEVLPEQGKSTAAVQPMLWRTAKEGEEFTIPDRLFLNSRDCMLLQR